MNSNQQKRRGKSKSILKQILITVVGAVLATVVGFWLTRTFTNEPPVARIKIEPTEGKTPLIVLFDGVASYDPEGDSLKFIWILEKDTISSKSMFRDTLSEPGSYRVELVVIDKKGKIRRESEVIKVLEFADTLPPNAPPVAKIKIDPTEGKAPLVVLFDGDASYDPEGDSLKFIWILEKDTISSKSEFRYTLSKHGSYRIELTVIDKKGQIGRETEIITVRERQIKVKKEEIPTDNNLYTITINTPYRNDTILNIISNLREIGFNMADPVFIDVQENEIIYYGNNKKIKEKVEFLISFFKRKFEIELNEQSFNNPAQDTLFTITLK